MVERTSRSTPPTAVVPWCGAAGFGTTITCDLDAGAGCGGTARPTSVVADLEAMWRRSPVAATMPVAARLPIGALLEILDLTAWLGTPPLAPHCAGIADPLWPLAHRVGLGRGVNVMSRPAPGAGVAAHAPDAVSFGGAARLLRCGDEWVALSLARESDVELLPAWLETELSQDAGRAGGVVASPAVWSLVRAAVANNDAVQLRERAALLGLPFSVVGEQRSTHRVLTEVVPPRSGRTVRQGRTDGGSGDRQRVRGSLDGLTVLNLASLWAGPLCAAVLGQLGAHTVTLESVERPDGGRHDPAMFDSLHPRTRFETVELGTPVGRAHLRDLVAAADVVIEGSRPRALQQLGIDARSMLAEGGPRVWVSITAHGRDGDAARRVGFGDDAAAAGGLVGWIDADPRSPLPRQRPVFFADAAADPITGLAAAAAVVVALSEQDRGAPGGRLLDVAMSRVAAAAVKRSAPTPSAGHGVHGQETW